MHIKRMNRFYSPTSSERELIAEQNRVNETLI